MMAMVLWWGLIAAIQLGIGFYGGGWKGVVFMGVISALGGGFLLFEHKTHQQ